MFLHVTITFKLYFKTHGMTKTTVQYPDLLLDQDMMCDLLMLCPVVFVSIRLTELKSARFQFILANYVFKNSQPIFLNFYISMHL